MKNLIRRHGELYWVDADREHHCSIYVYIDYHAMDWMSFVFCNATDGSRATKTIRLETCMPASVKQRHPVFARTAYWDIKADGYDKILMDMLKRPNSKFPAHTNWERIRHLYLRHDECHRTSKWWLTGAHDYHMPDYTNLWGQTNWEYDDNDPDWALFILKDEALNISIYASAAETSGLLVFDHVERYQAKKVAKLSILTPAYLEYEPNDYACMKTLWNLPPELKRELKALLVKPSWSSEVITNWDKIISYIDMDGAFLIVANGVQVSSVHGIPEDLPIPDYSLLDDNVRITKKDEEKNGYLLQAILNSKSEKD